MALMSERLDQHRRVVSHNGEFGEYFAVWRACARTQ
jgi:hypothetical protein